MISFAAVCAAQTPNDVTNMDIFLTSPPSTTAAPVYEKPVLKSRSQWLDVFPSEIVELYCQVNSSSDWNFFWYRNGVPVNDTNSVPSLTAQGSILRITVIPDMHPRSYSCKGVHKIKNVAVVSDSLDLTVHPTKPIPIIKADDIYNPMYPGESVTFECAVTVSSDWEYLWYHDGKPIETSNDKIYRVNAITVADRGSYHCKAKRGKELFLSEQSDAKSLHIIELPTLTVIPRSEWLDVFPGEEVEFACEINSSDLSDRYEWTYSWSRDGQQLEDAVDSVSISADGYFFNITAATPGHQGGYSCKAHLESRKVNSLFSKARDVTVYEKTPKPSLSKDPVFKSMYVGETLTLSCKVNVSSGWIYQWYKGEQNIHHDNETYTMKLSTSNGGIYWCKATRGAKTVTESSNQVAQFVFEIPVPSLSLVTKWPDVFPTESVKFSCVIPDSSDWTYIYRNGQVIKAISKTPLFISSASDSDAGQYSCTGQLRSVTSKSSSSLTLKVYDRKPSAILTQDPEYGVMFKGESVSFSCHINVSTGWEYIWLKEDQIFQGTQSNISVGSIGKHHEGKYSCQAKRGQDNVFKTERHQGKQLIIRETKPKPLISQEPNAAKVYGGEMVSFICSVGISEGWKYSWYINNTRLTDSQPRLVINYANSSKSGKYQCMATRDKTGFQTAFSDGRTIAVSEIPVPSLSLSTQWHDLFLTESVTLTCGMPDSSDWKYIWNRNDKELKEDGSTFSIVSASISERGNYSCLAKHKGKGRSVQSRSSSGLTLDVYDAKPSIILTQTPKDNLMHTGDSISFNCTVSQSSGWQYIWYRNASPLQESGNILNITSAVITDSGAYTCGAVRRGTKSYNTEISQPSQLGIAERPSAGIILLTGWSEVFSTDSLMLKCEVKGSQDQWNFTWYKEGLEIKGEYFNKYTVTPQDDPKQSSYTCKGSRTERPFYSKDSDSFRTKNLLLKRRVLLAISGCIFFGIIVVFLGCIALRFTRKPVDEEVKAEEAELFLTMAQLKDRGDAPCPMVEYITDASLNAPVKEGEENGTVCSETTSLVITPQQEQSVMTESHDTSENNGGLVSFK